MASPVLKQCPKCKTQYVLNHPKSECDYVSNNALLPDYSDTPGLDDPRNYDDMMAVKSFLSYSRKFKGKPFLLPRFFVKARRSFTRAEVEQLAREVEND